MKIDFKFGQFNGPLDLLLNLIEEQKMDINEVALFQVTEQYLYYLDSLEIKNPEELADFLVVATKLLFLKSRKLLPDFIQEEEGPSLEEQLRLYKMFVESAKKLNKCWLNKRRSVFRVEPPRRSTEFIPPKNLGLENLHESMVKLLRRIKPLKPLPHTEIDKAVSMKEKIDEIRNLLKSNGSISFFQSLHNSKNKTEVIIGFLALLELVKQKSVALRQCGAFNDILIEQV